MRAAHAKAQRASKNSGKSKTTQLAVTRPVNFRASTPSQDSTVSFSSTATSIPPYPENPSDETLVAPFPGLVPVQRTVFEQSPLTAANTTPISGWGTVAVTSGTQTAPWANSDTPASGYGPDGPPAQQVADPVATKSKRKHSSRHPIT